MTNTGEGTKMPPYFEEAGDSDRSYGADDLYEGPEFAGNVDPDGVSDTLPDSGDSSF